MVMDEVKKFFETDLGLKFGSTINEDTALIDSGLIDSFSIVKLVACLEKSFDIKIDIMDLREENFYSIKNIEKFVMAKLDEKK